MKIRVVSFSCIAVFIFAAMLYFSRPVMAQSDPANFIFDISEGNITVAKSVDENHITVSYGNNNPQNTVDYANTQEITITGTSTSNKIGVNNVYTSITLDGVDIQNTANGFCAFELIGNANVPLTLKGINTLTSGSYKAGLQVPDGAALAIQGDGILNTTGGAEGAGIGGGCRGAGGTITISSGTVTAKGGNYGAGIGGGIESSGGIITISGGTVNAEGGRLGAGIGGEELRAVSISVVVAPA